MSQYKSAYTGAQIDQAVEKVPQLEERVKAIEDNPPASTKEEIIENLGFTPVGYGETEGLNAVLAPVDADTLGGIPSEDYALKIDLENFSTETTVIKSNILESWYGGSTSAWKSGYTLSDDIVKIEVIAFDGSGQILDVVSTDIIMARIATIERPINLYDHGTGNTIAKFYCEDNQAFLYNQSGYFVAMTEYVNTAGTNEGGTSSNASTLQEYTADENITNESWSGDIVYRKVIGIGAIESKNKSVAHGITGVTRIWVDPSHSFISAGGVQYPLPKITPGTSAGNQYVAVAVDGTYIHVYAGSDANFSVGYVTVLYTKSES